MSGAAAELGTAWKAGIELAEDQINGAGGLTVDGAKKKISVTIVDDESTPAGDQRAIQDLLAKDNQIFLGPVLSASFATAYPALKDDDRRLVLTPSLAAESLLDGNNRLFKTQPSQGPAAIVAFARTVALQYKPERVAILQTKDPTGDLVLPSLVKGFEEAGVKVVYKNQVAVDTKDYLPFVSAMQSADPDLVITPYLDSVGGPFVKQAAQVGFTEPNYANYGGSAAQVKDVSGIASFSYVLTTRAVDNPDDPTVAAFRAAYTKKYGHEPKPIDFYALTFYDPLLMLGQAIEDAGTTTDVTAIGKALKKVTSWDGQALALTFDDTGLIQLPIKQIATVAGGTTTYADYQS